MKELKERRKVRVTYTIADVERKICVTMFSVHHVPVLRKLVLSIYILTILHSTEIIFTF